MVLFNMKIIQIIQIIIAVFLILAILLQNRSTGLSGIFGGASNVYRTKRGIEKTLFIATIILAALFILISLFSVIYYNQDCLRCFQTQTHIMRK